MTFSGVLLLADLLLLTELAFRPKQRSAWRWLALVSVNLALLATLTRGAWIGLLVPATILLALKSRRWLAAILVAAVLIVLLAPAPVRKRLESIVDILQTIFNSYSSHFLLLTIIGCTEVPNSQKALDTGYS